jgi:hypothetical protein
MALLGREAGQHDLPDAFVRFVAAAGAAAAIATLSWDATGQGCRYVRSGDLERERHGERARADRAWPADKLHR